MIQTAILLSDPDISAIDDSTESIGSVYQGARVGGFGDCAVPDFSLSGPLTRGEGGMIVTDDDAIAALERRLQSHRPEEQSSAAIGASPYVAAIKVAVETRQPEQT
jgi:dTDP-4-amino-4,6-dideoxygalactose transaminase